MRTIITALFMTLATQVQSQSPIDFFIKDTPKDTRYKVGKTFECEGVTYIVKVVWENAINNWKTGTSFNFTISGENTLSISGGEVQGTYEITRLQPKVIEAKGYNTLIMYQQNTLTVTRIGLPYAVLFSAACSEL